MAKDNKKEIKNKKHFFKDFKTELKKVIWPTSKQLTNNTVAVITIVLITAAIVFILDVVFDLFNEKAINRLKATIRNQTVIENVVEETDSNSEENTVEEIEGNNEEENESLQEDAQ